MRGYSAIGILNGKTVENIGSLWRTAQNFNCNFIFTIGRRYKKQPSDTGNTSNHVPLFEYLSFEDFYNNRPKNSTIVFIEQAPGAQDIRKFSHPERAIYILGAEDRGIPESLMAGQLKIFIPTPVCLNVAVAGSIVLYDRFLKIK